VLGNETPTVAAQKNSCGAIRPHANSNACRSPRHAPTAVPASSARAAARREKWALAENISWYLRCLGLFVFLQMAISSRVRTAPSCRCCTAWMCPGRLLKTTEWLCRVQLYCKTCGPLITATLLGWRQKMCCTEEATKAGITTSHIYHDTHRSTYHP